MGDFNVDFFKQNCSLYKNYKNILDLLNLNQLIRTVTRLTDTSSTLIDHIVCNIKGTGIFFGRVVPNIRGVRPVGTNLKLVRRVRAKNLLSIKAKQAKRAECLTAWGPGVRSRAPGGVQGQSPGGGPGGSAP